MDEKYNEYLYKMSAHMRRGLSEVQKKVNELYKIEELEVYDAPIERILAALMPTMVQVNDFHDYAEAVTGRMELNLDETDVHAVLDSVLTIADQLVEDRSGVRLEEDIEEHLPSLEADAERLTQALLHYIHNALKFTESGTIILRVKREANNVLFEVSDTGIGIPADKQELVFEPFETILEDKADPRLGFGIGLKIVERIVDLHDGETWFESVEGRGSSFFFTIPV